MNTWAIVNPTAGRGYARRRWPRLRSHLQAASDRLTVRWTSAPGMGTSLTRHALSAGAERVVAVGGDGTLHEVVNGFFDDETPRAPAAVCGFVACGTGSDIRHPLHTPTGVSAAARLRHAPVRSIDLLRLRYTCPTGQRASRYAVNMASFGLGGAVVRWAEWGRQLPVPPRLRYFAAIMAALATQRPAAVDLSLDGVPISVSRIWLAAVANGTTFGAGLRIAPGAQLDDGLLDVTVIRDRSVLSLLARAAKFYRGSHSSIHGVTTHRGRSLTARSAQSAPVWIEADGERLGQLPATIEVMPGALRLQA